MHEMSVLWLRVAAGLYSLGLLNAILMVLHRRVRLFRIALGAFTAGALLQLVSIVEQTAVSGHFPANNFFESASLCAFLSAALFLFVYWRYRLESLSVFIFPLVFLLTLVSVLGSPAPSSWGGAGVRDAWLVAHVTLVLVGYAALLITAVAAVAYLLRERQLKRKVPHPHTDRLPALGTLDELISRGMTLGFVFITLAVIAGSTWASIEAGTRWIGDARIVISLATWGIYLVMVFLRVSAGWRGRKAAIMVLTVLGCSALTWAAHTSLRALFT
ncbi:MAG: cytochrome c biogenesis protein CcsA [Acidobacteriota bacterium]